jgi:L-amino acid N-acyltransferase YncA
VGAERDALSLTVRPYAPGDSRVLTEIYRDEVLHGVATFETEPPTEDEMAARLSGMVASGYPVLVAMRDGAVLGYAYANVYRARAAFEWTVEDSIYIAPAARGQGIGRLLIDALVVASAERGFRQMIAVIGDSANVGSIRLHAAAGFAHVGVHPAVGWKLGRWVDTIIMQRALGAAASAPP